MGSRLPDLAEIELRGCAIPLSSDVRPPARSVLSVVSFLVIPLSSDGRSPASISFTSPTASLPVFYVVYSETARKILRRLFRASLDAGQPFRFFGYTPACSILKPHRGSAHSLLRKSFGLGLRGRERDFEDIRPTQRIPLFGIELK